MSNNQYSPSSVSPTGKSTAMHFQTIKPYAALVATAGPEHDERSSSFGSSPSSGSRASLLVYNEGADFTATLSRSHVQACSTLRMPQQHMSYGSPDQARSLGFNVSNAPIRIDYAACVVDHGASLTAGGTHITPASHVSTIAYNCRGPQILSLAGVPDSVAVQEMAFRQGQRDRSSALGDASANPFARKFDQLWTAFYKLGKDYDSQRATTPVNPCQQNFAWPVLINPYTQSLNQPNGSLDPAWSRKMIQAALNCMKELIRITCRRNTGWDKVVADIPLPAQEALVAFPDLTRQYEQLKCDAKEARAGGRPYGY